MTYCVALALEKGLVFASDTRTNAGVDYVTKVRKLHVFKPAKDRLFVILTAGNLATTQEILNVVERDLREKKARKSLLTCKYMFEAADYLGHVSVDVQKSHDKPLQQSGVDGSATLIIGGQIGDEPPELFHVYPQGNTISATPDTPFFQIGESKYGKPIIDRLVKVDMPLGDAARLVLASLDATIKSNATVAPPYDLAVYPVDSFDLSVDSRIEIDSEFYQNFKTTWQSGMQHAFDNLPKFDWEG